MRTSSIVEARLLAAVRVSAQAELPPAWKDLEPHDKKHFRPASRIALVAAELPSRLEMVEWLRRIAAEIRQNRKGCLDAGEAELWDRLAAALETLEVQDERHAAEREAHSLSDLAALALWRGWPSWCGLESPLRELARSFGLPPLHEQLLAGIAATLLRVLARRWSEAAREQERGPVGRRHLLEPNQP